MSLLFKGLRLGTTGVRLVGGQRLNPTCLFATANTKDKTYFDDLVKKKKVVVFMKGTPDAPRCGFSNAVVQVLRMHGVTDYASHDVLSNEEMRQGVKDYTNWPTIPQIFIDGEFVGGCDIMIQMHQNGDLIEHLKKAGITSTLVDRANTTPSDTSTEDKK